MQQTKEEKIATLMGQFAVLNEVVIALLAATPNRDSILRLALRNAKQLRDEAVEAEHSKSWMVGVNQESDEPKAWVAGADLEIGNYEKLATVFAQKKPAR